MPHRDTSVASYPTSYQFSALNATQGYINKLYTSIPNDGDDPTCVIKIGFQDYSLVVNSTELLYQLTLFKYLMLQVNVN